MLHLIDCHCHIEDKLYDRDRDELILKWRKSLEAVVCAVVNPKNYADGFALQRKYPGFIYLSAGIHPIYADRMYDSEIGGAFLEIRKYCRAAEHDSIPCRKTDKLCDKSNYALGYDKKCPKILENRDKHYHYLDNGSKCPKNKGLVAIGETGLDYYWVKDEEGRKKQKMLFEKQIELAKELNLPLVVHIRAGKDKPDVFGDALDILEKHKAKRALLHMFSSKKYLDRVLGNGWYISTNAIVQSSKEHKKIVARVSLERLMLETDAPYLVPEPEKSQGVTRNEPVFVKRVAERIAEVREIPLEKLARVTVQNSRTFLRI